MLCWIDQRSKRRWIAHLSPFFDSGYLRLIVCQWICVWAWCSHWQYWCPEKDRCTRTHWGGMGPSWDIWQPSPCAYLYTLWYLTETYNLSTQTKLSTPSPPLKLPPFSTRFPPLKLSTVHGLLERTNLSTLLSRRRFTLQQTNSTSIMKRPPTLMPIFLQCVRGMNLNSFFTDIIARSVTPRT